MENITVVAVTVSADDNDIPQYYLTNSTRDRLGELFDVAMAHIGGQVSYCIHEAIEDEAVLSDDSWEAFNRELGLTPDPQLKREHRMSHVVYALIHQGAKLVSENNFILRPVEHVTFFA